MDYMIIITKAINVSKSDFLASARNVIINYH